MYAWVPYMASHYKWYPSDEEVVVPFNATYSFPSQANKAVKITPRIPPKSGGVFQPGSVCRIECPSQGYMNVANTLFSFTVTMYGFGNPGNAIIRFQNNIQSIISRLRILYGSTPLEDIINYNVIVRGLTEWTSTDQNCSMDQTTISEGIGGVIVGTNGSGGLGNFGQQAATGSGPSLPTTSSITLAASTLVHVRQNYIQGLDLTPNNVTGNPNAAGAGNVPNAANVANGSSSTAACSRRYTIALAAGLTTQGKLIPLKFMAAQFAFEFTFAAEASCMFVQNPGITGTGTVSAGTGANPTYVVTDFVMIPEILEFDASYDAMFLKGLQSGGVPIPFASWHTYTFSISNQTNLNLLVQERSRSVKALFALHRRAPESLYTDSHTFFFNSDPVNILQTFQWRIAGRYFPAAPVQCSTTIGSVVPNGGSEAYAELSKALNIVGDYRLTTNVNTLRWAFPWSAQAQGTPPVVYIANELDYTWMLKTWTATGVAACTQVLAPGAGTIGSTCFAMATDLETSNGAEISGLNAEEQSDIALLANYSGPQAAGFNMEVYSYFDAMLILRENNVIELIQ